MGNRIPSNPTNPNEGSNLFSSANMQPKIQPYAKASSLDPGQVPSSVLPSADPATLDAAKAAGLNVENVKPEEIKLRPDNRRISEGATFPYEIAVSMAGTNIHFNQMIASGEINLAACGFSLAQTVNIAKASLPVSEHSFLEPAVFTHYGIKGWIMNMEIIKTYLALNLTESIMSKHLPVSNQLFTFYDEIPLSEDQKNEIRKLMIVSLDVSAYDLAYALEMGETDKLIMAAIQRTQETYGTPEAVKKEAVSMATAGYPTPEEKRKNLECVKNIVLRSNELAADKTLIPFIERLEKEVLAGKVPALTSQHAEALYSKLMVFFKAGTSADMRVVMESISNYMSTSAKVNELLFAELYKGLVWLLSLHYTWGREVQYNMDAAHTRFLEATETIVHGMMFDCVGIPGTINIFKAAGLMCVISMIEKRHKIGSIDDAMFHSLFAAYVASLEDDIKKLKKSEDITDKMLKLKALVKKLQEDGLSDEEIITLLDDRLIESEQTADALREIMDGL